MIRPSVRTTIGVLALCAASHAPARAQLPTAAATPGHDAPVITRVDIAAAWRNVELATAGRVLAGDSLALLNGRVDDATIALRTGRTGNGLRALHEAAADFGNAPAMRATARQLAALRVTLTPRLLVRGRTDIDPRVTIAPLYALGGQAGDSLRGTVRFTRGTQLVTEVPFAVATDRAESQTVPVGGEGLRRGDGGRIAVATAALPHPLPRADDGRWFTTTRNPDDVRIDLLRKADAFDTLLTPEMHAAGATFRARVRSLNAEVVASNRTPFADSPVTLSRDLQAEYDLLIAGGNPYANRYGDHWRVVRLPNAVVPVRLYVPLDVARTRRPAPLVVVLHDEGGDENTFPDQFSRIVGLAESARVVVASVNSDVFSGSGDDFNGIVAAIHADVTIDVERIYVIGHGRGGEQAAALAVSRPTLIAGVACIAGFNRIPAGMIVAPILVILGERDPISPPERLSPIAADAVAGGASVDVGIVPNQGHTLIVNAALPSAIEWLLRHTRLRPK